MQKKLRRLTGVFLAMAVLNVAGLVVMYIFGRSVIENNAAIIGRVMMIDDVKELGSTLADAETGQRGFLLTGEEKYLAPYLQAKAEIGERLERIDAFSREGRISPGIAAQIHHLARQKLDEVEQTVELRRSKGIQAAMDVVKTDQGMVAMGQLRAAISAIVADEEATVGQERKQVEWRTIERNIIFGTVVLLNLIFIGWVYRRVSGEMHARDRALSAAEEQRELLAVTLRSIGDAVIVTDTLGQVTFMNEVAQQLTGYPEAEARAMRISEVFKIICEDTRAPAESPVQKVLREGKVVGLANHTLLIRRDGTEVPIDDSGAPVRDRYGRIHGVVLVFRDFSEHKQREQELRVAREVAERANQAKDQFMAALSHELRTPLTPVLAMLTTWEANQTLAKELRQDLQMMRRNVELEARLIDDLLDLTRVAKGKLTINLELTDVHDILQHVQETCRSEANAKQVHVTMQLDAKHHHVMADPARLQQIFWNILRNATKFSRANGDVEVSTADTGNEMVEIRFTDHGIGIDSDALPRLFQPFEQGGQAITRQYGGLGLGLAISKALVDMQGGTLVAESEGIGQGARFTVQLPPASVEEGNGPTDAKEDREIPAAPRKLRILLVEDHADTARTMARLLGDLGHKVDTAGSMAEAMKSAQRQSPDLILSDIGLPDGDGVELLEKIRKYTEAPAIALTGFGMDEDIARTRAAGFRAHLTKPVNFQRLEMMVHQVAMNPQYQAGK